MTLTYSEVAEIVRIIDSSSCDEVSLELEGTKILIRRNGAADPALSAAPAPQAQSGTPAQTRASDIQSGPAKAEDASEAVAPGDGDQVCAPMVGTFYIRPAPDEPEFVNVGTKVSPGTPLCIIEVMKLFTTIEASRAGTVKAVLATDGDMVEYGQPLFVLE